MDEFVRRNNRPKINLDQTGAEDNKPVIEDMPDNPKEPDMEPENNTEGAEVPETPKQEEPKKKRKFSFKIPVPKTKKQWIVAVVIIALVLGATGYAVYWFIIRDTSPAPAVRVEPEPDSEPEPIYSKLSGREVSEAVNQRAIYAVQIENSPEARPQSGLMEADIVFEAIAEGGITRFNALFHDNVPANIGPIRSLRPYYIDWFWPFDAAIVHAGGSGEALSDVRTLGLKDIDHSGGGVFRRVSNRYAPHNLYSTGQQLLDLLGQRGYKSEFTGFTRKAAEPVETPDAKSINLNISRGLYNVNFVYDPASGAYLRSQGGSAHVDAESGKQLSPNVVVVPIMGRRTHPDGVHTQYTTTGSGQVFIFQDGTVTTGTWTKATRNSQWELTDANGEEIKLNPGQTWFSMVESADRVSYSP